MSYNQRKRKEIILKIGEWIKESQDQNEGKFTMEQEQEVVRKAMLVFGCTKEKAHEYMNLIFNRM